MNITVFGASGRTGQHVVEQALGRGHEVVAFVRSTLKLPFEDPRLNVVEGDAYKGTNVDEAVADTDAVISTLGQSNETPNDLLRVAGQHIIDAMEAHGVERCVTLVGAGVRTDDETVLLGGKIMGSLLKLLSRLSWRTQNCTSKMYVSHHSGGPLFVFPVLEMATHAVTIRRGRTSN